ncbi:hypothetical protein K432DRAFT_300643 [Lepidopterella palustris CBS 459.81]|uniref:C2H2-type domain-containing protein n=1 Tax=Lepidopterella palustris CBS 459.81 TaxID=1314670 RepID=A0A8E2E8M4_9PEZI|nr:hypothetical protein K432DRAFT_300643 [Lepidopterella palustris CBS 459.81]
MAASTRAITPTHTGPFSSANAPNTPTSISSVAPPIGANAARDNISNTSLNPNTTSATKFGVGAPLPSKSPRPGLPTRISPQPLTGADVMAEDRRLREQQAKEQSRQTSPNPALNVVKSLLGADQSSMSRPKDAPPAPTQLSEPLAKAAKNIVIPEQVTVDNMQTSPVSLSSFGSADSTTAPTATATEATSGPLTLSGLPGAEAVNAQSTSNNSFPVPGDTPTNRAFTFPGPAPPEHDPRAPSRGMSLPGYPQNSPKSPSTKRHKCPYCATDFTRHHNLKSHLLTHSQEKPYECTTCQARFRRLHDLKRHTKLHTGERPHTCPKCGRRFARGDALARHNKGQGGCAGRRSSFGIDEDMGDGKGDESMDGVLYHGDHGDDDKMDDDEPDADGRRRVSEPARKRQNTGGSHQGPYHQHSSTYPPVAGRMQMGNNVGRSLYPPGSSNTGSSTNQTSNLSPKNAPSSLSSIHFNASQGGVFAQGGMTESPKPISPGQTDPQHRLGITDGSSIPGGGRSPSMSQQIHQQQYARGAGRGASPMGAHGLPPPHANSNVQLPSLPGLGPTDMRMAMPNKGPQQQQQQGGKAGPGMLQHQQAPGPGMQSNQGSMSSHGTSSAGSMRDVIGGREIDVWSYVREMEGRIARQAEEHQAQIARLTDEVTTLRAQLAQAGPPQQQASQQQQTQPQLVQHLQQQPQPPQQQAGH